jgi:hypothetical protein
LGEQAVVLCQVEKAKEDMLNQLYSSIRLVLSLLALLSDDFQVHFFLMNAIWYSGILPIFPSFNSNINVLVHFFVQ